MYLVALAPSITFFFRGAQYMSHRFRCGFMRRRRRFVHFRSINHNLRTVLIVIFSYKRVGNPLKIAPSLIMHINTLCQRPKGSSLVRLTI